MVTMDQGAHEYVRLVLAAGVHDPDAVDAYYGPMAWQTEARAAAAPLTAIASDLDALQMRLAALDLPSEEMAARRLRVLRGQVRALVARVALQRGQRLSFDEESAVLYDTVAPTHESAYFDQLLTALDAVLPGRGPIPVRYEAFRAGFVVPRENVDAVFRAAIDAGRARTRDHIVLPAAEQFALEYVTGTPWSGYNWYQGHYRSVIQVNTDLPIYIDRALDLACHEGYPGHHVYNVLIEQHLVRERGWVEWSVYPLFSPRSLIAEGTANFGIAVAFPAADRLALERDLLFPLAGLDPVHAERYQHVQKLAGRLSYAGNEAARLYLDGKASATDAVAWLERYALMGPHRAAQRVRFFDRYRSYVINYNLGEDLIAAFVNREGGTHAHPARRWDVFTTLLRMPHLPGDLAVAPGLHRQ